MYAPTAMFDVNASYIDIMCVCVCIYIYYMYSTYIFNQQVHIEEIS